MPGIHLKTATRRPDPETVWRHPDLWGEKVCPSVAKNSKDDKGNKENRGVSIVASRGMFMGIDVIFAIFVTFVIFHQQKMEPTCAVEPLPRTVLFASSFQMPIGRRSFPARLGVGEH